MGEHDEVNAVILGKIGYGLARLDKGDAGGGSGKTSVVMPRWTATGI
jgi:hypothetical protein